MAAPNLKSPTTVTGKTAAACLTASLASVLSNSAGSGQAFKINTIKAANVASSGSVTVSVTHYRSSTHTYQAKAFTIAAASSLVVSNRDEFFYLEEGDAIYAQANATSSVDLTIGYEVIS